MDASFSEPATLVFIMDVISEPLPVSLLCWHVIYYKTDQKWKYKNDNADKQLDEYTDTAAPNCSDGKVIKRKFKLFGNKTAPFVIK